MNPLVRVEMARSTSYVLWTNEGVRSFPSSCKSHAHGDLSQAGRRATRERVGMSLPPVSPPLARLLYRSLLRTSARGKRPECLPMLVRHRL